MTPVSQVVGLVQIQGADLVPPSPFEQAQEFARHSKAENTLRGYRADWRDFYTWCESHSSAPFPRIPRPWRATWRIARGI